MDRKEQEAILRQLVRMDPGLDEADSCEQYAFCYRVYQALDKDPDSWALQEVVDARTLETSWHWRRKS